MSIEVYMNQPLESLYRSEIESIRNDANLWVGQDSIECPETLVSTDRLVIRRGYAVDLAGLEMPAAGKDGRYRCRRCGQPVPIRY